MRNITTIASPRSPNKEAGPAAATPLDLLILAGYHLAALLLLIAAILKLREAGVGELLEALHEQGILNLEMVILLARWLPWLEILLGLWAVSGIHLEISAAAMGALYLLFTVSILTASGGHLLLPLDCGCFGKSESWPALLLALRNTALALPLFFAKKRHRRWSILRWRPFFH
ncbi:MAG: MauE/DoxX family redox-associated membrane protein [Pseudomonadota bacterium]